MPTHQSITGSSDEDLLQRMIATHGERFDAPRDVWMQRLRIGAAVTAVLVVAFFALYSLSLSRGVAALAALGR